jgi:hypothetical protein
MIQSADSILQAMTPNCRKLLPLHEMNQSAKSGHYADGVSIDSRLLPLHEMNQYAMSRHYADGVRADSFRAATVCT